MYACPRCHGTELVLFVTRPVVLMIEAGDPDSEDCEIIDETDGELEIDPDDAVMCQTCDWQTSVGSCAKTRLSKASCSSVTRRPHV